MGLIPKIKIGRFLGKIAKTAVKTLGGPVGAAAVSILEGKRSVQIKAQATTKVNNSTPAPNAQTSATNTNANMVPILVGVAALFLFMRGK